MQVCEEQEFRSLEKLEEHTLHVHGRLEPMQGGEIKYWNNGWILTKQS